MSDKMGIGHIGWLGYDEGADWQTVAWCNIDRKALEAAGQDHPEVALYTDYLEMLKHPGLDAVIISTPNMVHAEQTVACLDAGMHVMVEKPMGINREECLRIMDAQKRSGRNLTVDFEIRASPFAKRIKSILDSSELGVLRRIEFVHHRGCWQEEGNGMWRTRPEKSGGLYLMEPIHEVDIFRHFAGEIIAVQSTTSPNVLPHYQFQDNVCSHFFFENGVMGTILAAHTHSAVPPNPDQWVDSPEYMKALGHDMTMILTLTGGSIGIDFLGQSIMINRIEEWPVGSGGVRIVPERTEDMRAIGSGFYHDISLMSREFYRRCVAGLPPLQDPLDAWKTHMVCLAAEQSVKEDFRRVKVDYSDAILPQEAK